MVLCASFVLGFSVSRSIRVGIVALAITFLRASAVRFGYHSGGDQVFSRPPADCIQAGVFDFKVAAIEVMVLDVDEGRSCVVDGGEVDKGEAIGQVNKQVGMKGGRRRTPCMHRSLRRCPCEL